MKGLATPIAAAALVALLAVATVAALRPSAPASAADRAAELAAELRCPDCQGLSVADSPTASAIEIRRQIDELLAAGRSPDEVRRHFADRYGQWILLAPTTPIAWWAPFVVIALGAGLLVVWLTVRPRPAPVVPSPPATDGEHLRRVREEADALDA